MRNSERQRGLLARMVVTSAHWHAYTTRLVLVPSCCGGSFCRELMVVGRAPNGWDWDEGFLHADVADMDNALSYVDKSIAYMTSVEDPLGWIDEQAGASDGYNTNRSAFWRVSRGVLEGLCGATPDGRRWSSRLVWSNLYKIAPAHGGNPSNSLADKQEGLATELLQQELADYRPKAILFLTGRDWADAFLRTLPGCRVTDGTEPTEGAGTISVDGETVPFVICPHPQGKSEEPLVTAAVAALREAA